MDNQIIVECKRVKFFSRYDEDAFFEWMKKITSITDVKGKKDTICLFFDTSIISDEDLGNLVALFRRYKIKMKQLEMFLNDSNREKFSCFQKGFSINMYPAGQ